MAAENTLHNALSPYLQQHAGNPVHWMEWGSEALGLAKRLQRPILLSVGYSACHWCHVMAHESFEDNQVADLMNAHFVNIKVDREERPDLDRIYQMAHQLLTGRGGGWPLTVFLDPDSQAPFFAGTYFPPERRHGMMSFPELLERIHEVWSTRREELRTQHLQVQQALQAISQPRPADEPVAIDTLAEDLVGQLAARFDREHGGFGTAPKFPQAPVLALLVAIAADNPADDEQASQMLGDTLEAMARFGLRDHLAGGFFRYCVDQAWEIPHFEKMLSDNALLLGLYAETARRWKNTGFERVCQDIVGWLQQEMALDGGGFAASLDADSPDGEGAYYVWTPQTVNQALDPGQASLFNSRYGLDGPPNFEKEKWHLVIARSIDELTGAGMNREQARSQLDQAHASLLKMRRKRPAPGRDDKLIASWNGLAIESLARAGRLLNQPEWTAVAGQSLNAVAVRLFGQEPPRAVWRDGRNAQLANLEDHASVLLACLELLQWRFESRWFNLARRLARRIDRQFVDDSGAAFLTSLEHEPLITRPLAFADEATPAGAGLAVLGLSRLGHLCGDTMMLRLADTILTAAAGDMASNPVAHATLIRAGLEVATPPNQVLMGGPEEEGRVWQKALTARPELRVFRIAPDLDLEEPPELIQTIQDVPRTSALVCTGLRCLAPAHSLDELNERLRARA
ncbi:MAG: thioredoxin domain-containing protein [Wenzhouxiangella sp.]